MKKPKLPYYKVPDPIPFTREAYQQLQKKLKMLTEERTAVLVRLQTAREQGDLSENGAYKYAKLELGSINRQLRTISHQLRYGVVTESTNAGVADFGRTITISDGSREMTFMLVSHYESDPQQNKLSIESPLGKSLKGKQIGESFVFIAPSGEKKYTVVDIS